MLFRCLLLELVLLLARLLELLMLGPRIWGVQLLRRRAMPYGLLLLLLQGRRRRSAGCGHGLVKGRRGVGTLLAANKRGRGGEVRCLLHEAIVELWRRRSGEVVTGIRRGGRKSLRLRCSRRHWGRRLLLLE